MNLRKAMGRIAALVFGMITLPEPSQAEEPQGLQLQYADRFLTISGGPLTDSPIQVHYLEAYCRAGSTDADWVQHTVIPHEVESEEIRADKTMVRLRHLLEDGLVVDHVIRAGVDEVDFEITAHNPTSTASQAHWAQPCIRVGSFAGAGPEHTDDKYAYLSRSFVFLNGELATMPTKNWATQARYTPGQVWRGPGVPREDVNPRPLHPEVPSIGIIGCYSEDGSQLFATAFEPYQELFQGVIRCLHSDFRLGGLEPQETKTIRGKIYIVPNDIERLVERYRSDFPDAGTLR